MTQEALSNQLEQGQNALNLGLSATQQLQLIQYLELIGRWNRVYNLTAIRDPRAMLVQHVFDCLAVVSPLRRVLHRPGANPAPRLLDVGSGAGLPGVVLAICEPAWSVTCVDTVGKKASFIRQVGAELGLANLQAEHQRVEALDLAPCDVITSRAFASLADFVNLTRRHRAADGLWMAMKARLSDEERRCVPDDISVFHVEPLTVPALDAERCLVWLRPAG